MTAGVEGLPTDARDRLAGALKGKQWVRQVMGDGYPSLLQADEFDLADAVLSVVAELCDEARADELHDLWMRFDEDDESIEVALGGAAYVQHLIRARMSHIPTQQPTCQQRHTTGTITMCCQQPQGHGADVKHQGSDGSEW